MKVYNDIEATGFVKTNGTSEEVLCADGSTTAKVTKTSQLQNDSNFITKEEIAKNYVAYDQQGNIILDIEVIQQQDGSFVPLKSIVGNSRVYYARLESADNGTAQILCCNVFKVDSDYKEITAPSVEEFAILEMPEIATANTVYISSNKDNTTELPTIFPLYSGSVSLPGKTRICGYGTSLTKFPQLSSGTKVLMKVTASAGVIQWNLQGIYSEKFKKNIFT